MKTVIILSVILLAGCSPKYVRVVEYGGGGMAAAFTGEVGGCSVYTSENIPDTKITYVGKNCTVETK